MKVTVMNKLKQPLSLNLNNGGDKEVASEVLVLPRQKIQLNEKQFNSVEVQAGIRNKDLIVISMEKEE